jgi:hypothetical protein
MVTFGNLRRASRETHDNEIEETQHGEEAIRQSSQ